MRPEFDVRELLDHRPPTFELHPRSKIPIHDAIVGP
jgi:hypothetical protein